MQQIQYYKAAWGDIKNSPGWFGKLCLLALISFIPVFGLIVVYGYLYGWAREIAWGTHEPMPARIFANDDGKLYRRGWFILVLMFVFALVPGIVVGIGQSMQGAGIWGVAAGTHTGTSSIVAGLGLLVYLIGLVGALFLSILAWIGSMRISIYDRLSAGFQLGKIWKMFRRDTGGVMRIFGMELLVGLIIGIILSVIIMIVVFIVIFAGVASLAAAGYSVERLQYSVQHMGEAQLVAFLLQFFAGAGIVGFFGLLIASFLSYLGTVFLLLLVARAMGYWTMQFDVPRWRGQDDPMPFEAMPSAGAAMPANPYPPAAQAGSDPYSQPVQQQGQWQQPGQPAQQPVEPAAVAAPVVPFPQTAPADAQVEGDGAMPDAQPVGQPSAAEPLVPGQLSGFTYSGVSSAPMPTTPTGADPAEPTAPDLLVVVPETPEEPPASESETPEQ